MFVDVSNGGGDGGAVSVLSTALEYVILPEFGGAGSDCESGHCHCHWHEYDCWRRVSYVQLVCFSPLHLGDPAVVARRRRAWSLDSRRDLGTTNQSRDDKANRCEPVTCSEQMIAGFSLPVYYCESGKDDAQV